MADRPLRILHVAASTMGGVGLLLHYQMRDLDPERFRQTLVCGAGAPLDAAFERDGLDLRFVHLSRSAFSPGNLVGFAQIERLLARERFDVVHTHTSVGGLYGRLAARLHRVPVKIWTIHGYASHPGIPGWLQGPLQRVERALDPLTDHYIAISRAMCEEGIRKRIFTREKVTVIPNGLDLGTIPLLPPRSRAARRAGPVICTVARLEPQKGVEFLIRAMPAVLQRLPAARLRIAGDGPLRGRLEALCHRLGVAARVEFLGWRQDVAAVLAEADLFCVPSLWEGFGLTLVEAMAAGRAVVASRVDGIPEVVEDGVTGTLVPPADPAALAAALAGLLEDPDRLDRMGAAGRARAEQRFDHRRMLEAYGVLYQRLVCERGGGAHSAVGGELT